jgi:hypothetical protein
LRYCVADHATARKSSFDNRRQVDFKNFSSFSTIGKVALAACGRLSHSFK